MNSQAIVIYVLKTIFIAGIFLGYYWLALRNKKLHQYNRFYLLFCLVLSIGLPLLKFNRIIIDAPMNFISGEVLDYVINPGKRPVAKGLNWDDLAIVLSVTISLGFLSAFFIHIRKIYRIKRNAVVTKIGAIDLVQTDEEDAPFTFLNNLFWKQSIPSDQDDGKRILKHELTHIQQKHTLDRLFCQLLCSIIWINPFFWIIQKELLTIHEFIADGEAVGDSDTENFARMLLRTHYGNHFLPQTQSFFYSSIKRRLIMLTTAKNTRFSYARRLLALPLLVFVITLFSLQVNASPGNTILPGLAFLNKDGKTAIAPGNQEPATFPGGKEGWLQFLHTTCNTDKIIDKGSPPGVYAVKLSFIVDKDGDVRDVKALNDPGYGTKEDAMRVLLSSPKWVPAKLNGKSVVYRNTLKITYVISEE